MDRIKLTRNLGRNWPHPWRENEIVEAEPELADALCERGLAVRVDDTPRPAKPKRTPPAASQPPEQPAPEPAGDSSDSSPEPSAAGKPTGGKSSKAKPAARK